MSVDGERRSRLHRRARRLRPQPKRLPYYLHTPNGDQEPAPGWYMETANLGYPVYLGANAFDAEVKLVEMQKTQVSA